MNCYYFVDGSALINDIKRIRVKLRLTPDAKLSLVKFAQYFCKSHEFAGYNSVGYRRFVVYFVNGEDRLASNLILPNFSKPGEIEDIRIEFCGKKIAYLKKADNWLNKNAAPKYVLDSLHKSEKAVDTQICCDALHLAGTGKLDRLFIYTNDADFVPLCRSLRQLGANINLFHLSAEKVNEDLAAECDAFQIVHTSQINQLFETPANG